MARGVAGEAGFLALGIAGDAHLTRELLERLPNTFIGVGNMLRGVRGPEAQSALESALAQFPHDRVVLETDSPHLSLGGVKLPSLPGEVRDVAAKLAELWGMTVEEVRARTTSNARALYRF